MNLISRNFFIVFDRNQKNRKNICFNVNFFYLKSFNKKTYTITYVKEPFLKAIVIFGFDFKNKFRPLSFLKVLKDGNNEPIDPKLFKRFLVSEKNQFIAFSSQTSSQEFQSIKKMLHNFQFNSEKIINLTFCKSCLENNEFKILNKKQQINSYKNQTICSDCALENVLDRAKLTGLISSNKISPKLKNFFNHMILKFKDINKVINSFKTDFNPVRNREITLYDIERSPKLNKKYLNYSIDDIPIPLEFQNLLKEYGIQTLLPIQAIAIENGLLDNAKNQLIMSPTSSGKTLIGELAGISRILKQKSKMLYLVPIVALANVRTEEYEQKYKKLNLKVIKRIGESLLDNSQNFNLDDIAEADIIVATYEAIDYILRSGNKDKLKAIGTIIVDEIQTLIDPERGYLLDGLIARLKSNYNHAQFLYLSATIGAPEILAKKLESLLINFNNRPIPIERHLILCLNETIKLRFIVKLIQSAFSEKSIYGFKGQSIIFTNSRKKCESLSSYLRTKEIKAESYHSGLTSEERKQIEEKFQYQTISTVVATAALAAGVDFPAKQVIFESLAMGIKILTIAEFEQMLGRAGRLGKHDIGYAYLLVEPGKFCMPKMKITEEDLAIKLLNGKIKDFELDPNEDRSLTEVLAFISMFQKDVDKNKIYKYTNFLINADYDLELLITKLVKLNLVLKDNNSKYNITNLGQAVAQSFLTVEKSLEIIDKLKLKTETITNIVLELKPLKNVYLSRNIVADLSKNINMKYFSNNFFSSSVLSLMNAEYVKKRKKFSNEIISYILKWLKDLFNCNCKDNPYCDCGRINLEKKLLSLRIEKKLSIEEISDYFKNEYQILVFKGDIVDYLENLIYSFESILNILKGIPNLDSMYKVELNQIPIIIEDIKNI